MTSLGPSYDSYSARKIISIQSQNQLPCHADLTTRRALMVKLRYGERVQWWNEDATFMAIILSAGGNRANRHEPSVPTSPLPSGGRSAIKAQLNDANNQAIEYSPVAPVLISFMDGWEGQSWLGNSKSLLELLTKKETSGSHLWPDSAKRLSNELRRLAPDIRRHGYEISFNVDSRRSIKITKVVDKPDDSLSS